METPCPKIAEPCCVDSLVLLGMEKGLSNDVIASDTAANDKYGLG